MQLSENFNLNEFTFSQTAARLGLKNIPGPLELVRLQQLAQTLEEIRAIWDKPLIISSGYRSPQLNKIIGGSPSSQHCKGEAADFNIIGVKPKEVIKQVLLSDIVFDQIILEFNSWVHVSKKSKANRKQILVIDNKGTKAYTESEFLKK